MSQYPPPGQYPPPPGQYPPPPGGYPPPGQGGYWQESPKGKGLAITALVLGILALLSFWTILGGVLFGLFGLIFGIIAFVKARKGTAGGTGMAVTGLILSVLALIGSILIAIVGWSFFVDSGGKDLIDCLDKAGNDQSKIDECERKWNQNIEDRFSVTLTPRPTP
ncbi:DUF4190 domain-containing protein [Nocardia lijiangensis]|uniref:DUF4190 domain-containing protein n=1 Tax=Nocardia lijiangensis TaxID=299618 RepID=UPI00082B7D82|nr:DUF4190 domain-containing protein [Nocardia lijiangensis]